MKKKVLDLLGHARKLEAAISARVETATRKVAGPPPAMAPLEIALAIVDVVEQEIQPAGRGQHTFPFNHIKVVLHAPTAHAKAHLQGVCEGSMPLERRIADRLRAAGCPVVDLSVKVSYVPVPRPEWLRSDFHVEFARRAAAAPVEAPRGTKLDLIVTQGTAGRASYSFGTTPVTIGRGSEVRDTRQRLIRTNLVAFVEGGGEVNESVSRRHAHVDRDPVSGACRVYDDGSAQGTTVIRRGEGLAVPRGSRGLKLQSGDEIVLGRARLRVRIVGEPAPVL